MTGLEIALLVLGTLFVIISFFIVGGSKDKELAEGEAGTPRTLSVEEQEQIRQTIADILEEEEAKVVSNTDAALDKLSNEKIIAVSELSDQVLAKISSNHKEVVFMYDMLQKKEEEIRETNSKIEDSKREYSELYSKMKALVEEEAALIAALPEKAAISAAVPETSGVEQSVITSPAREVAIPASRRVIPAAKTAPKAAVKSVVKTTGKAATETATKASSSQKKAPAKKAAAIPAKRQTVAEDDFTLPIDIETLTGGTVSGDDELVSKNDKILALHKKKKSVMEISKLLGIGQGEVKLVIDLYSGK